MWMMCFRFGKSSCGRDGRHSNWSKLVPSRSCREVEMGVNLPCV
jgi:hypothetical protein